MHTTFFLVLLVYYVYNHMLKHIRCIKYIKYLNLYRFRAFIGPPSGATKICEVMNCTSPRQVLH
jgi:hypothetical protein